jgi:hypothetical protein
MINGENGDRYLFTLADWKGSKAPQAKDEVDFVVSGTNATEVYPITAAAAFAVENLDTDAGRKALAVLRDRPQVILAAVALIASLFLNFVQMNGAGDTPVWKTTAVGIPGKVATLRAAATDSITAAKTALANINSSNPVSSMYGSLALASVTGTSANPAAAKEKLDEASSILALTQLVALIFLVPAGAVAVLLFEYRQKRNKLVELATGAASLIAVAATFYAREAGADYVNKMVGAGADSFKQAFQLGLGGWLIGICGLGLVATALGYLRRTPGIPG